MRDIKFRAWDKEDEYMNSWELIKIDVEYSLMQFLEMDRFEIMQFTGLKDKNGKEIYEGDLLDGGFAKVVFEMGQFMAFYQTRNGKWKPYGTLLKYMVDYDGEVVGNIYENPELLEEAQ